MPYQHVQFNERPARAARAAAQIVTRAVVNEEASGEAALLAAENARLRRELAMFRAVQQARPYSTASLRALQHAHACIDAIKQVRPDHVALGCVAARLTVHAQRGPSRAASRHGRAPAARQACLHPALCPTTEARALRRRRRRPPPSRRRRSRAQPLRLTALAPPRTARRARRQSAPSGTPPGRSAWRPRWTSIPRLRPAWRSCGRRTCACAGARAGHEAALWSCVACGVRGEHVDVPSVVLEHADAACAVEHALQQFPACHP